MVGCTRARLLFLEVTLGGGGKGGGEVLSRHLGLDNGEEIFVIFGFVGIVVVWFY